MILTFASLYKRDLGHYLKLSALLIVILAGSSFVYAQGVNKTSPIPEYKKVGNGPQILLLIPCMSCRWNEWEEFMERNQARFTMYAVTIPGFGGTPTPDLPKGTNGTPWRDNAINALSRFIDEHKLRDVTVIGHSWGTMLGAQLAYKRQDVVTRLIAVDGSIESTSWTPRDPKDKLTRANQIIQYQSKKFEDAEEWRRFNSLALPSGDSVPRERVLQMLKLHGSFMATPKEVLLQYWRENLLVDLTGTVKRLTIPILDLKCLRGQDMEKQRKDHLENLKQAGTPAQTKTIFFYDTRHFIMYHRPQELDQVVTDFISGKEVKDFTPQQ